jgi:hypothetical protein
MIRLLYIFFAFLVGSSMTLSGCMGFEARLASPGPEAPDIETLLLDQDNYDVYFAGRAVHLPTALAFDAKGDGLKLTFHEYWVPVTNPRLTREIVGWMAIDSRYSPALYRIEGKDGNFYGYLYSNEFGVPITSPEPGVLRLGNMHPTRWDVILDDD